jgi:poly(3-hydroxybutyrate) depolymerase
VQPRVGHYGVFNGSRFRAEIAPRISDFIATFRDKDARLPETAEPVVAAREAKKARATGRSKKLMADAEG